MKCPYCETEFEVSTLQSYDQVLQEEKPDSMQWDTAPGTQWEQGEADGLRVYQCQSCGGEIVGDENTGDTACPY